MKKRFLRLRAKLRHAVGGLSIRSRMIGIYILLILLPACLLMLYFCQRSARLSEKAYETAVLLAFKQADSGLAFRLSNVKNISDMLFVNTAMEDYLTRASDDCPLTYIDDYQNITQLENLVQNVPESNSILHVRIFVKDKPVFDSEKDMIYNLSSITQRSWYQNILEQNGRIYWKGSYSETFFEGDSGYVFSCQRILRNLSNPNEVAGVLSIDLPESTLFSFISNINIVSKSGLLIADADGTVISCADKKKIGSVLPASVKALLKGTTNECAATVGKGGNSQIVLVKRDATTGWYLVAESPETVVKNASSILTSSMGVILLILTLVIFLLAIFFIFASVMENMTRRVRRVTGRIREVGIESIQDGAVSMQKDIHLLEGSVDKMIFTVKNLMEEAYQSRLNEQEAKFRALQAQINPHFLYNTLGTIKWMQLCNRSELAVDTLNALSKYYRLSLNKGRDIVSVSDELDLVNEYMKIQRFRYQDNFKFSTDIDKSVENLVMPKLTLQPIVENALIHGIQLRDDPGGEITLTAHRSGDDIIFIVTDDGVGMDEERLQLVLSAGEQNSGKSYGLYNVNNRLKLFSGPTYGIDIASTPMKGTVVTIRISAINNRE